MTVDFLPSLSSFADWIRDTDDHAQHHLALLERIEQAYIWNVNAALPANMELPQDWLRFSDHDPVVVDLHLRQSSTSD